MRLYARHYAMLTPICCRYARGFFLPPLTTLPDAYAYAIYATPPLSLVSMPLSFAALFIAAAARLPPDATVYTRHGYASFAELYIIDVISLDY